MSLEVTVARFLHRLPSLSPGDLVLVAFSGGPDSTALLHALAGLAPKLRIAVRGAHLDHGLDPGSADRARRAARLARRFKVDCVSSRRDVTAQRRPGESLEATARRVRYGFLAEVATGLGARFIATAHHADDQAETLLLRILYGTGLRGLAGIAPRRGRIVRPLLELDRRSIADYLARNSLDSVDDPTNRDLASPRNRIRHLMAPRLRAADPDLQRALLALAPRSASAIAALDRRLASAVAAVSKGDEIRCDASALATLPEAVRAAALGALCALAGRPAPAASTLTEIERQHRAIGHLGCDLGDGWRLESDGAVVRLFRPPPAPVPFAYTLRVPGEVRVPELSLVFRLVRRPVAPWMFRGSSRRAGMAIALAEGDQVTVRSRQPGDRIRPLGCDYSRRLKDVLIDRKVPRRERDRLPLLCIGELITWVPGVTIDERARLPRGATSAWVAEIEPQT